MPGAFFVAHVAPTLGLRRALLPSLGLFPGLRSCARYAASLGLDSKASQREKPPHAERHSREGCTSFQVPPLRVHVVAVAEQQPALIDEVPDGDNVPGAFHDGQLRSRQLLNPIQELFVPEILRAVQHTRHVPRDEQGGVAVLMLIPVAGQPDDSVVRNAAAALHIQRLHVGQAI